MCVCQSQFCFLLLIWSSTGSQSCVLHSFLLVLLFAIEVVEQCVIAGSVVPKLVGEKKSRDDDVQSMSASVFFVLYPALADYIVTVLRDASYHSNTSQVSEISPVRSEGTACVAASASQMGDVADNVFPVVTSSLLFPVLSLLCRLSPGLAVTDEGRK